MKGEDLKNFRKGDVVVVIWHDACGFRVSSLTEEAYVTRKETIAPFYGVFADSKSGFEYLVLRHEKIIGGGEIEGTAIPVVCIEKIYKESDKDRERAEKKSLKATKLLHAGGNLRVKQSEKKIRFPFGEKRIMRVWKSIK